MFERKTIQARWIAVAERAREVALVGKTEPERECSLDLGRTLARL
jgi:hypothetical protein